jgi:hypothetical protein
MDDCLKLASRAWRRPLTKERRSADPTADHDVENDHRKAIRAPGAHSDCANVSPRGSACGCRRGQAAQVGHGGAVELLPLVVDPDDELRAAAAGELSSALAVAGAGGDACWPTGARRLSTEFRQWLGFYH